MSTDDHLLEIEDLGPDVCDGIKERAGNAGSVVAGDGDEQGLRCEIGHARRLSVLIVPPGDQVPNGAEVVSRPVQANGEEPRAHGIQALGAACRVLG